MIKARRDNRDNSGYDETKYGGATITSFQLLGLYVENYEPYKNKPYIRGVDFESAQVLSSAGLLVIEESMKGAKTIVRAWPLHRVAWIQAERVKRVDEG